jgi:hypothetical protein
MPCPCCLHEGHVPVFLRPEGGKLVARDHGSAGGVKLLRYEALHRVDLLWIKSRVGDPLAPRRELAIERPRVRHLEVGQHLSSDLFGFIFPF